ncbi:AI-2E family transporter [Aliihoeflea sp. 40Bstr573]|uniref:AI-2E family transporter n=1 Tax=Aliihoeflea sp. 40Bstr573 TaxID=2696467 RepID=UPI0020953C83|nr:AI-2E family transporter [Aliihoeflea sp. 40Bstr573]
MSPSRYEKRPPIVRLPPKSNSEIVLQRGSQVALIALGLVGLCFALYMGRYILAPVAFALVIGLMLGPVAARIEARGISPYISAVLVFMLFIFSVCLVALALVGPLSYWADRGPQMWQELQLRMSQLREPMEALRDIQEGLRSATGETGLTVSVDENSPMDSLITVAPAIGGQVLIFMATLYFFIATRHETRLAVLRLCVGRRLRWRTAHIFRDIETLVSRYLLSITAINMGLAVAVTCVLWLAGVPSPALWGILAGLLNFVMYIGPAIMAAILFAVGLVTFDTISGSLMPPLVYLAVNLMEAQFITPMIIGRMMTLNPFIVLIALTFWIWIWGPIGGFVAIPALLAGYAMARNLIPGWGPPEPRLPD